jgi:hypothetical protein
VSESSSQAKRRLEELENGERVARERYELYRARVYGPRPTSIAQLRTLDQAWKLAQSRLHRARDGDLPGPATRNGASR